MQPSRLTYVDHNDFVTNEWFTRNVLAAKRWNELRDTPGVRFIRIERVRVPADLPGMVQWLNDNPNTPLMRGVL